MTDRLPPRLISDRRAVNWVAPPVPPAQLVPVGRADWVSGDIRRPADRRAVCSSQSVSLEKTGSRCGANRTSR